MISFLFNLNWDRKYLILDERTVNANIKEKQMRKTGLGIFLLALAISGCGSPPVKETFPEEDQRIIQLGTEFYEEAGAENQADTLEKVRSLVEQFGARGYTAIDGRNQIDMSRPEQALEFCQNVEESEKGKLLLIEVLSPEELVIYHFQTQEGQVNVKKRYYEWKDGKMVLADSGSFSAENWKYWENGYLMFSGVYYSEESYALTLSGEEEYAAFRILPLPKQCRELNRTYLLLIGYEYNNLFITDWTEDEFGELDFYDLYDHFCVQMGEPYVPEGSYESSLEPETYRIPAEAFERMIQRHFSITSETLQKKTAYYPDDDTYAYCPRGFQDMEYPEYPYPEVVDVTERKDGTIVLTVNAVFPYKGISKVFAHEVTVRPLPDGQFQYVSNHILPSESGYEFTWYTPRNEIEDRAD